MHHPHPHVSRDPLADRYRMYRGTARRACVPSASRQGVCADHAEVPGHGRASLLFVQAQLARYLLLLYQRKCQQATGVFGTILYGLANLGCLPVSQTGRDEHAKGRLEEEALPAVTFRKMRMFSLPWHYFPNTRWILPCFSSSFLSFLSFLCFFLYTHHPWYLPFLVGRSSWSGFLLHMEQHWLLLFKRKCRLSSVSLFLILSLKCYPLFSLFIAVYMHVRIMFSRSAALITIWRTFKHTIKSDVTMGRWSGFRHPLFKGQYWKVGIHWYKKFFAKNKTDRPPVNFLAMLVEAETFFCSA